MRGAAGVQRAAVEITFVGGGRTPAVGSQCGLVQPADNCIYCIIVYVLYILDVWIYGCMEVDIKGAFNGFGQENGYMDAGACLNLDLVDDVDVGTSIG